MFAACDAIERRSVSAEAVGQETRDPANCGYADTGHVMDAPIGEAPFEKLDNLPAVHQGLKLRRST